jgi:hypothetical protein
MMRTRFSANLMQDLRQTIEFALTGQRVVNLPVLAEQIRQRNEIENVALEDIAEQIMIQVHAYGAAIEFDRSKLA